MRDHHDTRRAVTLDTHRVKQRLIGIVPKLARDLPGRDRQQVIRHHCYLDLQCCRDRQTTVVSESRKRQIIRIIRIVKILKQRLEQEILG